MNFFLKTDELKIFVFNSVAVIEFNAEKTKNAISFSMAHTLGECITKHGATSAFLNWLSGAKCGALVLKSNLEKVFVSGGDVKDLNTSEQRTAILYSNHMRDFCIGLSHLDIPSVTLLTGGAFGGGAELALATDYRFVDPNAALHFWQSQWGVPGGWNGMLRLGELAHISPRKVGLIFACATSFDANAMLRMGLADAAFNTVNEVSVAAENLAAKFLECEFNLRHALLRRGGSHAPLLESDTALFTSFWLGPVHKAKLTEYQNRRAKKS